MRAALASLILATAAETAGAAADPDRGIVACTAWRQVATTVIIRAGHPDRIETQWACAVVCIAGPDGSCRAPVPDAIRLPAAGRRQ